MIALARKYRPRRFADLLVQDHVALALRGAVARARVGHGYLLTGPRGVGKTSAARILAMALNCERRSADAPTGEPCGECDSCGRIWSGGASLDVVEIDAASHRGVDDARELRERAMYAASQAGHHKVYIIDEAHMLTREAWNALLKILEEPPPGVVFVFATTEPQKIANTAAPVLSRLQRFDFRRIGPAPIRARLRQVLTAEGLDAEDDALALMARHADGGMRDALSVLDQCLSFGGSPVTAERVREVLGLVSDEVYGEVLTLVAGQDAGRIFPLIDRLLDAGADLADFIGGLADLLRALLLVQLGGKPEGLTEGLREAIAAAQSRLKPEDTVRMLRLLVDTEASVRRSANARLAVETLLLRWALMDRTVDLEAVLAQAGTPGARPDPAPGPAPRPRTRDAAPAAAVPHSARTVPTPAASSAARPPGASPVSFSLEGVRSIWPDVVEFGREQSRFLGEALQAGSPIRVAAPDLTVGIPAEQAVLGAALARGAAEVEGYLGRRLGGPVRLRVEAGGPAATAGRPKRLSEADMRAERLTGIRGTDPALDAAVDELDLEIVEERPPGGR